MRTLEAIRRALVPLFGGALLTACGGTVNDSGHGHGGSGGATADAGVPCDMRSSGADAGVGSGPIDGILSAIEACRTALSDVSAEFDADVAAVAEAYGLPPVATDSARIDELIAAIRKDVAAHVVGDLTTTIDGPTCESNSAVADEALLRCEAEEGCGASPRSCPVAACKEVGTLNGLAHLRCGTPVVGASFALSAAEPPDEAAAFQKRLDALHARALSILSGQERISSLATGKVNGTVVFDPPPIVRIRDTLQELVNGGGVEGLGVAPGCAAFIVPRLDEAARTLQDFGDGAGALLSAEMRFTAVFR